MKLILRYIIVETTKSQFVMELQLKALTFLLNVLDVSSFLLMK